MNFRCQVICYSIHALDIISCNFDIQEQVEWYCKDVHPEHGKRNSVSHVPIIEVNWINEG